MAKAKQRQPGPNSRAARRAASPPPASIVSTSQKPAHTTRSSTSPTRPSQATVAPHVLAARNAGITKKPKKGPMKRGQRLRHLKGIEKAADNMEKLEVKVLKSVGKGKKVKDRRKGWEEVNSEKARGKSGDNVFGALGDGAVGEGGRQDWEEREWVSDEEMDNQAGSADEGAKKVHGDGNKLEVVVPQSVPLPLGGVGADEEEGYL